MARLESKDHPRRPVRAGADRCRSRTVGWLGRDPRTALAHGDYGHRRADARGCGRAHRAVRGTTRDDRRSRDRRVIRRCEALETRHRRTVRRKTSRSAFRHRQPGKTPLRLRACRRSRRSYYFAASLRSTSEALRTCGGGVTDRQTAASNSLRGVFRVFRRVDFTARSAGRLPAASRQLRGGSTGSSNRRGRR